MRKSFGTGGARRRRAAEQRSHDPSHRTASSGSCSDCSRAPRAARSTLAVELAELFQPSCIGLFIEDAGLRHLAGIPFAREISALGGLWRPVEAERALDELDLAAGRAARRFDEAARRVARRQFKVVRGGAAEALAALSPDDVVAIGAPAAAAERATEPFASLLAAAFRSAAAVMLIPARPARRAGPVVALAAYADDPSVATAAAIAHALGEKLVVVDLSAGAGETWLTRRRAVAGDDAPVGLRAVRERLAVISRGAARERLALTIVATRGAPTLIIDGADDA